MNLSDTRDFLKKGVSWLLIQSPKVTVLIWFSSSAGVKFSIWFPGISIFHLSGIILPYTLGHFTSVPITLLLSYWFLVQVCLGEFFFYISVSKNSSVLLTLIKNIFDSSIISAILQILLIFFYSSYCFLLYFPCSYLSCFCFQMPR